MPATSDPGIVIIGAGEAGVLAALTLREREYAGPITIIGAERHPPYERPPLSKTVLTAADLPIPTLIGGADMLTGQNILCRSGVVATGLDREARAVQLQDGTRLSYSRLLLATGARPRTLSVPETEARNVLYLRTFNDALALRARLSRGARLVVIGGGFIGLEVAASAVERGCDVTIVEAAPRVLGRAVPAELAAIITTRHRTAGVTIIEGAALAAIEERAVILAGGRALEADVIVVGIGAVPQTCLAEAAGLAIDNGIRVDEHLATDDPAIFAAGDCCSFPHPVFGGRRLRLEAWRNAGEQGRHAANAMLGATESFASIPWFWSEQYGDTLQIAGLPDEGDETVTRDNDGTPFLFHLKSGRIVGASAFGPIGKIARDIRLAEKLIETGACPPATALQDPAVKLKTLLQPRANME
ncbi:ferredoxin reductase (plasmid) [Acidiphilium multivorum AIU301]|uniref:Ferredoxin reductase n=2 Tax=Acidiphilium multivorum TaxID=62140 RepID=F0J769_ACIMA|nr:FAD-dependent oxidoreductase [Acidiphilium multivorum]BAJ82936.1 ferredoxin reductase [Acidiphilium multivorum AIU301]GAN72955.1 FAD dependent pyridine nucleotide-disulfide oxidoreductase/ferredoxin reductase [Acidiphilium multivorum AIU301]